MDLALRQFRAVSAIFDALDVVVYVADLETYELLFVNSYTAMLFGADCVGKRCFEVLQTGQSGPCHFCTNDRLVHDGVPGPPVVWEFQNTITRRWYLCIDKAIPWTDGRLVRMEAAVDITARREAEEFRQQYVSLISHDLRTPLHSIALHGELLRRSLSARGLAEETGSVEAMLDGVSRMAAMLGDLLETTRLESGNLQLHRTTIDLAGLVASVQQREGSGDAARLHVEAPHPVTVSADPERLARVLENLLSNALRYSSEDVILRVERQAADAIVSVVDRGPGIASDELPRLFQRFYRAASAGTVEGLGLGLYGSRLIIEAHGGRIWAESELGRGSAFRFSLPIASDSPR